MNSSKSTKQQNFQNNVADYLPVTKFGLPVGGLGKRIFDIVFSVIAIASFAIPLIAITLIIRIATKGPAIYVHERIGFGGKAFPCLKFRTMNADSDKALENLLASDPDARKEFMTSRKLKRDPRIIPGIGEFLRKTSLDELPQFFNVLAGHMSVVGPRPITEKEVLMYGYTAKKYLSTRPGITGLWQVSGRSQTTFEERTNFDRTYVDTWSFGLDLQIICRTVFVMTEGAY